MERSTEKKKHEETCPRSAIVRQPMSTLKKTDQCINTCPVHWNLNLFKENKTNSNHVDYTNFQVSAVTTKPFGPKIFLTARHVLDLTSWRGANEPLIEEALQGWWSTLELLDGRVHDCLHYFSITYQKTNMTQ